MKYKKKFDRTIRGREDDVWGKMGKVCFKKGPLVKQWVNIIEIMFEFKRKGKELLTLYAETDKNGC